MKKVKYSYEFWEHIDDFLDFLAYPETMKAQAITKYAQYLEKKGEKK